MRVDVLVHAEMDQREPSRRRARGSPRSSRASPRRRCRAAARRAARTTRPACGRRPRRRRAASRRGGSRRGATRARASGTRPSRARRRRRRGRSPRAPARARPRAGRTCRRRAVAPSARAATGRRGAGAPIALTQTVSSGLRRTSEPAAPAWSRWMCESSRWRTSVEREAVLGEPGVERRRASRTARSRTARGRRRCRRGRRRSRAALPPKCRSISPQRIHNPIFAVADLPFGAMRFLLAVAAALLVAGVASAAEQPVRRHAEHRDPPHPLPRARRADQAGLAACCPAGYHGQRIPLVITPHGRGVDESDNALFWGDLPGRGRLRADRPGRRGTAAALVLLGRAGADRGPRPHAGDRARSAA